jgi:ADP-ribose pyrophosphatase YjhB (NUDIX family)
MPKKRIRPIAVCIIRKGNRILLEEGYDPVKRQRFFRPLGGGIDFGECARDAVRREFREELDVALSGVRLLGVLENIFTFDGKPGHEIVFVFEADFVDATYYSRATLEHQEAPGKLIRAIWKDLSDFDEHHPPLYPERLLDLLRHGPGRETAP